MASLSQHRLLRSLTSAMHICTLYWTQSGNFHVGNETEVDKDIRTQQHGICLEYLLHPYQILPR
jgi:hypothetical protein